MTAVGGLTVRKRATVSIVGEARHMIVAYSGRRIENGPVLARKDYIVWCGGNNIVEYFTSWHTCITYGQQQSG